MNILSEIERKKIWIVARVIALVIGITAFSAYCYTNAADYVFSEAEDKIYNTLRAAGYTKAGACGILGNIAVENSRFEADLYGNHGTTYGLFQWNDVGERMEKLFKWCNNRSLYPNRIDGQLAFAMHELEGGDPIAKRVNSFLKSTNDPSKAAMEFTAGFERCVGASLTPENDATYVGTVYPEYYGRTYQAMGKRMAMAEKYFEGYASVGNNPSLVLKIDATPTPGLVFELEEKMQQDLETSLNVDTSRADNKKDIIMAKLACIITGYFCGCMYWFLFFVDRNKFKNHNLKSTTEIPHARTVMSHLGIKKASYVLINDVFKLLLAIGLTVPLVKGIAFDEKILLTGFGVIIGNACPYWNKFRGGLGFTVTIITLILYMPIWGVLCCIIGLYFAYVLQSLTVGIMFMSMFMIPFAYRFKSPSDALAIALILITLVVSHQRILLRYFDRNVLHKHYRDRRNRLRSA